MNLLFGNKIKDKYIESFDINKLEKETFGGYDELNIIKIIMLIYCFMKKKMMKVAFNIKKFYKYNKKY